MSFANITKQEKHALAVATVIALLFGCFFLKNFFTMFVLAGVLAYLFSPIYLKLKKHMGDGSATVLTFIVSLLVVVIPLTLIIIFAVAQTGRIINNIGSLTNGADLSDIGTRVVNVLNDILSKFSFIDYRITEESLISGIETLISKFGNSLLNYASQIVGNFFGLITSFIIYIFVFISFLKNGPKLITMFRELNPLGTKVSDLYLARTAAMVRGTVRGQFIIAIVQGFIGATTIAIAGWPELFFLMFIVLSALSVIPLGGGILAIPIGILMVLLGNVWGGILVVGGHLLITTNIDNVLRPRLVPREARLDPALMIVSVFAGMGLFGFLGIIIGPTIMVLIVTTIRVYLEVYRDFKLAGSKPETEETILSKISDLSGRIFKKI